MGIERKTGEYTTARIVGESYRSFVPFPLPPDPPIQRGAEMEDLLEKANRALGRLDALPVILPDISLFLYFYGHKEALLSSQIEGTQSSFSDILLFEKEGTYGVKREEAAEVIQHVAAMNHGLKRLKEGFPLSLRLIREIHAILLKEGRGSKMTPGEFRITQNWISGTRPGNALYVPPPPDEVMPCMGALEKFLHDDPVRTPVLMKAALAHVQFETIHPFLDGNGRMGRLLITFLLCAEGALSSPLLYLSLYFKTHRTAYYDHLQAVRLKGEWEEWLRFFFLGVKETADQATDTARVILDLFDSDRQKIQTLGRAAGTASRVHQYVQKNPIISILEVADALGLSRPTANSSIQHLQKLNILSEFTGRQRGRLFMYSDFMRSLEQGTELTAQS